MSESGGTSPSASPGGGEVETSSLPAGSPERIEAEIDRTRQRLASTVDAIADRVAPSAVAARGTARAKAAFHRATHTPEGALDTRRLAIVGAAVGGVLLLIIAGKLRVRRSR